jgi:hypothetical protein
MIPMPVNPKLVVLVDDEGTVRDNANNLGNDLEIVVAYTQSEFDAASRGLPYSGTDCLVGDEKS